MVTQIVFGTIGGLGLLIYGIQLLGDGLQQVAGERMRSLLAALTKNPLRGIAVGAVVTSIIQSSSATTVLLVGFINAGLLNLYQAVGVIMGANIGTTVTAQIIALKLTKVALPAIGIGCAMTLFSKRNLYKNIGQIILGFGLLFLGLNTMSGAVKFLRQHEAIVNFLLSLSHRPYLGVLAGILVTVTIQSSSASIGLLLSLSGSGLINLSAAIPILLGDNIGTCVTALLASIGTSVSAKRAAVAHTVFNLIGTVIVLLLLPYYMKLIQLTSGNIAHQIANAHTLFNVANTIILFPFIPLLIKLVTKLVPGEEMKSPNYLDERLLTTPVLALEQARNEIIYMGKTAEEMLDLSMHGLYNKDYNDFKKVIKKEHITDVLEKDIADYLVKISQKTINPEIARQISSFLHVINDVERIGDHAENLTKLSERLLDGKFGFSEEAMGEIDNLYKKTLLFLKDAVQAISDNDQKLAQEALSYEDDIDDMVVKYRQLHVERLNNGKCKVIQGLIFTDMLHNFEKIGDHAYNLCEAVLGIK